MTFISEPGLNKRKYAEEVLGGTPSIEDVVQKVAELEYLEDVETYKIQRAAEYPDFGSQLDYIYHNGVDAWKTNIIDPVKAAYPKQAVDETELASRKAQALFDYQLEEYTKAQARLDQYQVALGREQVAEVQDSPIQLTDSDGVPQYDSDGSPIYEQVEVITVTTIDPLPETVTETQFDSDGEATVVELPNPLITKDNEERAAAQAVVDATPQAVIDEYNS